MIGLVVGNDPPRFDYPSRWRVPVCLALEVSASNELTANGGKQKDEKLERSRVPIDGPGRDVAPMRRG